ncbi:MAG TPA: CDP-diacylglycerol--glycerol-3-phosphate 3-phosphatidyltransferase [Gammaproteobacteria bacterium]|nr:CDP-diacylglycerol--glycerol-3-phosphate 3-phosphatidyltransferase [Gammaproteobacteria bacterium]
MHINIPNGLTLTRIVLIPVLAVAYYLPLPWGHQAAAWIFVAAAITDWLDGFMARYLNQYSAFGAFLDPVADKLVVSVALVMLVADPAIQHAVFSKIAFVLVVATIIGREITISALREWMAELGNRTSVAVNRLGKVKTTLQMAAIIVLLYEPATADSLLFRAGEMALYLAGSLTLWSMVAYWRAAKVVLQAESKL